MELLSENIILYSENITFNINEFKIEKEIFINKNINYGSILKYNNLNYIYYRDDSNINKKEKPDHETTKRYIINNIFEFIDDTSFIINLGIASHNFRLFNIKNNLYGVGGQSHGIENYNEYTNSLNKKYIDFNEKNNIFLNSNDYNVNGLVGNKIISPYIYCPYYANGLYLFEFNNLNLNLIELNNKLPIISGIKNGRHDGHYGFSNNSNTGITVFDSTTNLLYNTTQQKYFLYQRSNFGTGIRNIQYCTSDNLLEWSDFDLIKYSDTVNLFESNIYYGNFFKLDGVNNYIGIIPFNLRVNSDYYGTGQYENYKLYYSNDCVNWNYIGILDEHLYYNLWMIIGEPLLLNNTYYFYFNDIVNKSIIIKSVEKNRFSYAKSIENKLSKIIFKSVIITNKKILINFKTYDDGYIKMQLLDCNQQIIDNYSFDNFDTIYDSRNEFNYPVSWNNDLNINIDNQIYIEICGINFELFSISV
jgi:hypothetical protein